MEKFSKPRGTDDIYGDLVAQFLSGMSNHDSEEEKKPQHVQRKYDKTSPEQLRRVRKKVEQTFDVKLKKPVLSSADIDAKAKTYIDLLEEFLDFKTENDLNVFISSANDLEKTINGLQINNASDIDKIISKLWSLQMAINSTIKIINDENYEKSAENESDDEDSPIYSARLGSSIASGLDKWEFGSIRSYASSYNISNASFRTKTYEVDSVDCQFCNSRFANLQELIFHFRNCQNLIEKNFKSFKKIPGTHFQLINDFIKCNVCNMKFSDLAKKKHHERSNTHKRNLKYERQSSKNHLISSYIYCNSCKVLIPDTFIQFQKHLENEEHENILASSLSFDDMARKGYHCVISRTNIIKCLICPRTEFKYDKEGLEYHCKEFWHKKRKEEKFDTYKNDIFCEKCNVCFELKNWDLHVSTVAHVNNLKNRGPSDLRMRNEYCIFCEEGFSSLWELAAHLERNRCIEMKKFSNRKF